MSEYGITQGLFTKISNPLVGEAHTQMVVLWDKGPGKPVPPKRPEVPKGKEGDPEYDLAMVDFREGMEEYEAALKRYKQQKIEHADFVRNNGGPYEITMWSCDAADALARAPERYCISAKTRGYEKLKNRGLPIGMTPGHGQAAQEERERQGNIDLEALRRADPVFGQAERAA